MWRENSTTVEEVIIARSDPRRHSPWHFALPHASIRCSIPPPASASVRAAWYAVYGERVGQDQWARSQPQLRSRFRFGQVEHVLEVSEPATADHAPISSNSISSSCCRGS